MCGVTPLHERLVLAVQRRKEYVLCLSKIVICFPKTTVLMFVWCRAYGCRSVSVGLIFLSAFPVGWSPGDSLSGFDGPIEGLARCALV